MGKCSILATSGRPGVEAFLTMLATERKVSASTHKKLALDSM